MIICLAANPSIDKLFEVERLVAGEIHQDGEENGQVRCALRMHGRFTGGVRGRGHTIGVGGMGRHTEMGASPLAWWEPDARRKGGGESVEKAERAESRVRGRMRP